MNAQVTQESRAPAAMVKVLAIAQLKLQLLTPAWRVASHLAASRPCCRNVCRPARLLERAQWGGGRHWVSAGKLYIFDTGSQPPLDKVLEDHRDSGFVEHIWHPPDFGNKTSGRCAPRPIVCALGAWLAGRHCDSRGG